MTENKKVIILNKPFIGNWLNDDANIGHEIIDFVKADDGKYYVYNSPYGSCPDNIQCLEDDELDNKKYTAEYMILTGPSTKNDKGSTFDVLYVIKLKKKLHTEHFKRNERAVINVNKITYGGKMLEEIYPDKDTSLLATFEANEIYEVVNPIHVDLAEYNFQRNKGYIYSDKLDYKQFDIVKWQNDGWLKKLELKTLKETSINNNKTFLDLIHLENNEQVFTNIMHSILSHGNLLQRFVTKFAHGHDNIGSIKSVNSEKNVVGGRCDIYATCENNVIIIENKVFSGLNGIKNNKTSQLSTYYKYANKTAKPICFVTVPNTRVTMVEKEIEQYDPDMLEKYTIVTYENIADFIEENRNVLEEWNYRDLINDIIQAFRNLSKLTKLDVYAQKFSNKVQSITDTI